MEPLLWEIFCNHVTTFLIVVVLHQLNHLHLSSFQQVPQPRKRQVEIAGTSVVVLYTIK